MLLSWMRCLLRRRHEPMRHPLGGFRCATCGVAGADLEAMGFGEGSGYVLPLRRTFSREPGRGAEVTRSTW